MKGLNCSDLALRLLLLLQLYLRLKIHKLNSFDPENYKCFHLTFFLSWSSFLGFSSYHNLRIFNFRLIANLPKPLSLRSKHRHDVTFSKFLLHLLTHQSLKIYPQLLMKLIIDVTKIWEASWRYLNICIEWNSLNKSLNYKMSLNMLQI